MASHFDNNLYRFLLSIYQNAFRFCRVNIIVQLQFIYIYVCVTHYIVAPRDTHISILKIAVETLAWEAQSRQSPFWIAYHIAIRIYWVN